MSAAARKRARHRFTQWAKARERNWNRVILSAQRKSPLSPDLIEAIERLKAGKGRKT